jgi:hypothetical protein
MPVVRVELYYWGLDLCMRVLKFPSGNNFVNKIEFIGKSCMFIHVRLAFLGSQLGLLTVCYVRL